MLSVLIQQVCKSPTVKEGVEVLLKGLFSHLQEAGTDHAALAKLQNTIRSEAPKIVEAVIANTPAETKPVTTTSPVAQAPANAPAVTNAAPAITNPK